jgi:Transglycosylase SLT domain
MATDYKALAGQIASQVWPGQQGFPELFQAVVGVESGYNPNAYGSAGEIGLSQLMPSTAVGLSGGSTANLWDPQTNLTLGAEYLRQQISASGSWQEGVQAYNAGPGHSSPGYLSKVINALGGGEAMSAELGQLSGSGTEWSDSSTSGSDLLSSLAGGNNLTSTEQAIVDQLHQWFPNNPMGTGSGGSTAVSNWIGQYVTQALDALKVWLGGVSVWIVFGILGIALLWLGLRNLVNPKG